MPISARNLVLQLTVGVLLLWVRDHLLQDRPEMFMKENSVYGPPLSIPVFNC